MQSVLYDPRAGRTEAERRAAEDLVARRRRLNGNFAQEQAAAAAHSVSCFEKMIEAVTVEAEPLPASEPSVAPPIAEPEWFSVVEEIVPEVRHANIADIQRAVATRYNVTKGDLMSSRRTADIVRPRQIAMYLARTITMRSLPEIGRRFGGRDHTTVLHAVKKIAAIVEADTDVADEVNRLRTLIQEIC